MIRVTVFPTGDAALVDEREVVVATEREYATDLGGDKLPVVELTMRSGDTIVVHDAGRMVLVRLEGRGPLDIQAAEAEHARRQAVALAGPMKTVPLQPRMTGLAVWDDERVYKLNAHQHDQTCHPYTCGTDSTHRPLVATRFGWQCADCGFTQAWADAPPAPKSA